MPCIFNIFFSCQYNLFVQYLKFYRRDLEFKILHFYLLRMIELKELRFFGAVNGNKLYIWEHLILSGKADMIHPFDIGKGFLNRISLIAPKTCFLQIIEQFTEFLSLKLWNKNINILCSSRPACGDAYKAAYDKIVCVLLEDIEEIF